MNVMNMESTRTAPGPGVLFKRRPAKGKLFRARDRGPVAVSEPAAGGLEVSRTDSRGKHRLAFAGIFLFTLLMYSRPHEIWPQYFGWLPLPKLVAVSSILIYVLSKLTAGERLIIWTLELKLMTIFWALGLFFAPVAASPSDSFNVLFDPLIKILIVFALQITLIDTRSRYRAMLGVMVFCQILYSVSSISTFMSGGFSENQSFHARISGWGEYLSNPNDIACLLALMAPLSVILALSQRGWKRWLLFFCVAVAAVAILCTYSRSGFLALIASSGLLVWKATRGRRLTILLPVTVLAAVLLVAAPGKYMTRLSTIFNPETDPTNSAQERQEHMKRAMDLAIRRPIVGVGIGNFHIYAINEMRAHNAFLETAAELGVFGLIAFLLIIFAPLRSLIRIERETSANGAWPDPGKNIVSGCLQASFVAFVIYAFFGSIQYDSYLYSLVAFAVAFRRIHAAEIHALATAGDGAEAGDDAKASTALVLSGRAKGSLWRSHGFLERRLNGVRGSR